VRQLGYGERHQGGRHRERLGEAQPARGGEQQQGQRQREQRVPPAQREPDPVQRRVLPAGYQPHDPRAEQVVQRRVLHELVVHGRDAVLRRPRRHGGRPAGLQVGGPLVARGHVLAVRETQRPAEAVGLDEAARRHALRDERGAGTRPRPGVALPYLEDQVHVLPLVGRADVGEDGGLAEHHRQVQEHDQPHDDRNRAGSGHASRLAARMCPIEAL
jgi:hypothetical protein